MVSPHLRLPYEGFSLPVLSPMAFFVQADRFMRASHAETVFLTTA